MQHTSKVVRKRGGLALLLAITLSGLIAAGASVAGADSPARQQTATPVQLEFPTPTPTQGPPTETPTRTPTSQGPAVVEAAFEETRVRAWPDIDDNILGTIYPGEFYAVLGRRFNWYQIEYPNSPSGTGWVYNEVVNLIGDEALIPDLEVEDIPTVDPNFSAAQETAAFITATPGAIFTLTAQVLITPTGVFTAEPGEAAAPTLEPGAPLPTFTIPPFTNTPIIIPQAAESSSNDSEGGLPPIVPILALAALGLMGLLASFLRRL
ncbi:MAG: SH3 domain-containing protein [Anaerolineae bacterium]|nr:SH3 domain-containing protein [Anaerolineae bacterium]